MSQPQLTEHSNKPKVLEAVLVVLLSIALAVCYGIIHDQFTVRLCLEYFTVGHTPIFGNQPATLLAILWGAAATWWMGLAMGIILAVCAIAGPRPIRNARSLIKPMLKLLGVMALSAIVAGAAGYYLAQSGIIALSDQWSGTANIAEAKRPFFLCDAYAHLASYGVGLVGSFVLAYKVWKSRRRIESEV